MGLHFQAEHSLNHRCCFMIFSSVLLVWTSVFSYNNGVAMKPPLGWNTWCTMGSCGQNGSSPGLHALHDICTEKEIKSVAEAMISTGLAKLGYIHINLDDCVRV